ncbi:hypothetical protein CDD83_2763 [Cordyceps sp. RAO-2017]|nr:hypothetical protein CDD83_2763 [Cordyceps sp. RAO-2017]
MHFSSLLAVASLGAAEIAFQLGDQATSRQQVLSSARQFSHADDRAALQNVEDDIAVGPLVSTMIHHPLPGQEVDTGSDFNVEFSIDNLLLSDQTIPYFEPQRVDSLTGEVLGHVQVIIERMEETGTDWSSVGLQVVYFHQVGIDSHAVVDDLTGRLSVQVQGGLTKPGRHRICTVAMAENQQPVAMPSVESGPMNDCTWFSVESTKETQAMADAEPTNLERHIPSIARDVPLPSGLRSLSSQRFREHSQQLLGVNATERARGLLYSVLYSSALLSKTG